MGRLKNITRNIILVQKTIGFILWTLRWFHFHLNGLLLLCMLQFLSPRKHLETSTIFTLSAHPQDIEVIDLCSYHRKLSEGLNGTAPENNPSITGLKNQGLTQACDLSTKERWGNPLNTSPYVLPSPTCFLQNALE